MVTIVLIKKIIYVDMVTIVIKQNTKRGYGTIHSFIPGISIAPLQVLYYSEALPTTA